MSIKTNKISKTDGTMVVETDYLFSGTAKAWVSVNQSGTQSIQDSFNVSSITDLATGQTDVVYTNSMSSGNYAVSGSTQNSSQTGGGSFGPNSSETTANEVLLISRRADTNATVNNAKVSAVIHGDLA